MPIGEDTKLTAFGAEGNYLSLTVARVHVREGLKRVLQQRGARALDLQQEMEALVSTGPLRRLPVTRLNRWIAQSLFGIQVVDERLQSPGSLESMGVLYKECCSHVESIAKVWKSFYRWTWKKISS